MKKLISLLFIVIWSVAIVWATPEEKNFTISGEIVGMEDGAEVVLSVQGIFDIPHGWVASQLKEGKFTLQGATDSPRYCSLAIIGKKGRVACDLIAYDENVVIKGKVTESDDGKYEWEDLSVEGSALYNQLRQKIGFREDNQKKLRAAEEQYIRTIAPFHERRMKALREGRQITEHDPELVKATQAVEKARKDYQETMQRETEEAVRQNLDSFWGPLLMSLNYHDAFIYERHELGKELYSQLSDEAQASFYGQVMRDVFFPEDASVFPDFVAENLDGEDVSSLDLRQGKKCVIVDFWASYCVPCREAIPGLKQLYADYADKGLEIISVSTDLKREAWLKALDEERMPWPTLWDTKNVYTEKFHGLTLPLVVVVDGNGKIVGRNLKGDELRAKVKEILNQ